MAQQTVTLVSAEKKSGNNKKGAWFFYIFKDAGGNTWQTEFNSGLGSQLAGALDQSVTLTYHEEQRGDFTNSVIDQVDFGGKGSPEIDKDPGPSVNAPESAAPSSKDESIARAVAFKGVVELVACNAVQADKIVEAVEYYTQLLLTGSVAETAGQRF